MTPQEIAAVARLGGRAAAGITSHVEHLHRSIADRAFAPAGPVGTPVRVVHDGISTSVYKVVRGGFHGAGAVAHTVLRNAPFSMPPAQAAHAAVSVLNAVIGHQLTEEGDALAITMAIRSRGQNVALDGESLATAIPNATERIVVFIHGLGENEFTWRLRSGEERTTYGTRLAADLGYTPVYVRYNTGRHVSDNGEALSHLLAQLVESWPVGIERIALVGHSMGGLVARSACAHADDDAPWVSLVRDVVYLGSPHGGSLAARAARNVARALARLPETRPYAAILDHSPGIRDLRHGYITADDWSECDAGTCLDDHSTDMPLLATANHYAVSATLLTDERNPAGRRVGDLLVHPASANGYLRRREHLAFEDRLNLKGRHHFDLLNDPAVYEAMHRWLGGARNGFASEID